MKHLLTVSANTVLVLQSKITLAHLCGVVVGSHISVTFIALAVC